MISLEKFGPSSIDLALALGSPKVHTDTLQPLAAVALWSNAHDGRMGLVPDTLCPGKVAFPIHPDAFPLLETTDRTVVLTQLAAYLGPFVKSLGASDITDKHVIGVSGLFDQDASDLIATGQGTNERRVTGVFGVLLHREPQLRPGVWRRPADAATSLAMPRGRRMPPLNQLILERVRAKYET